MARGITLCKVNGGTARRLHEQGTVFQKLSSNSQELKTSLMKKKRRGQPTKKCVGVVLRCLAGAGSLCRLPRRRSCSVRPTPVQRCATVTRTRAGMASPARGCYCSMSASHDLGPVPCQDHCKRTPDEAAFCRSGTMQSDVARGLADGPRRASFRAFCAANSQDFDPAYAAGAFQAENLHSTERRSWIFCSV